MRQVNELNASEIFSTCYHLRRPSANKLDITVGQQSGSDLTNGWQTVRVSTGLAIILTDFTRYLLIPPSPHSRRRITMCYFYTYLIGHRISHLHAIYTYLGMCLKRQKVKLSLCLNNCSSILVTVKNTLTYTDVHSNM
jgi:hypothetical protein